MVYAHWFCSASWLMGAIVRPAQDRRYPEEEAAGEAEGR
jgi:hypothetical protein